MLKQIMRKLTSRKFLAAVALVVTGLLVMFRDIEVEQAQTAVGVYMAYVPSVVGALMAILGALGFMKAEASIDAERQRAIGDTASAKIYAAQEAKK